MGVSENLIGYAIFDYLTIIRLRLRLGKYSLIFTAPEAKMCFITILRCGHQKVKTKKNKKKTAQT